MSFTDWKNRLFGNSSKGARLLLLFFGLFTALGQMLGRILFILGERTGVPLSSLVPASAAVGFLFFFLAVFAVALFGRLLQTLFVQVPEGTQRRQFGPRQLHLILMVSWLPCYIAYYPAIYSYDAEPQLFQYTGAGFDDHHPLFHTLTLGLAYDLGQWLNARGIPIDGMALHSFFQMLVLSFAFVRLVMFMTSLGLTKRGRLLLMLWLALFPPHPLMAVSTTKDTYFTAFLILLTVSLARLLLSKEDDTPLSAKQLLPFVYAALFLMLFRKNGFYMMLVLLAVLLIAFLRHRKCALYRMLFLATALSLALFLSVNEILFAALDAKKGEAAEALNLPLQQIARTYAGRREALAATGELEEMLVYENEEGLRGYRPYISDAVKLGFQNDAFAEDPAGFAALWAKLFFRYPRSYLFALLYHTMGAWYPLDVSHTLVYRDWWRNRTGYFITNATPVFAERFVKEENLLPPVRRLYELFATDCVQLKFVPLQLLFSPFLYLTGTFFLCLYLLIRKRRRAALSLCPLFVNLLIVLAGPCIIARYFYPFIALFPLLIGLACSPHVTETVPLSFRSVPDAQICKECL